MTEAENWSPRISERRVGLRAVFSSWYVIYLSILYVGSTGYYRVIVGCVISNNDRESSGQLCLLLVAVTPACWEPSRLLTCDVVLYTNPSIIKVSLSLSLSLSDRTSTRSSLSPLHLIRSDSLDPFAYMYPIPLDVQLQRNLSSCTQQSDATPSRTISRDAFCFNWKWKFSCEIFVCTRERLTFEEDSSGLSSLSTCTMQPCHVIFLPTDNKNRTWKCSSVVTYHNDGSRIVNNIIYVYYEFVLQRRPRMSPGFLPIYPDCYSITRVTAHAVPGFSSY